MLFNSAVFLFAFLPATLLAYFFLGRFAGFRAACALLVGASLVYYGWWNPKFLLLLVPATLANAALGYALCRPGVPERHRRLILWAGLAGNLALLGYFKYAGFLVANVNAAFGSSLSAASIVLPLGIPFFTFQKIAFLVDAYQGKVRNFRLLNFLLFVMFFPQLIAGPIVHHREIMPQFDRPGVARFDALNFGIGLTIFAIGLFKKVVLADGCALIADPVFGAFARGEAPGAALAWAGTIAYTFQLYFDFSGYSDMAVGLARMFNVDLPVNFNSPYKARSIIDFWRRWHITLSRFLRDYLYFPLGGNRRGPARRYLNLMATMLLGGLWHGASWAFVLWGAAHGVMLAANHGWRALRARVGWRLRSPWAAWSAGFAAWALTFILVASAWVPFRMAELRPAARMLRQMYDPRLWRADFARYLSAQWDELLQLMQIAMVSVGMPPATQLRRLSELDLSLAWLAFAALVAFALPNVYQLFRRYEVAVTPFGGAPQAERSRWRWEPTAAWAAAASVLMGVALMQLGKISPFLYFQF